MLKTFGLKFAKHFVKHRGTVAVCFFSAAVVISALWLHYIHRGGVIDNAITQFELKLLDMRFLQRGIIKPVRKVGILAIDEKSIQKFGRWPFPRKIFEQGFTNLKNLNTGWIGFDVIWSESERTLLEDVNLKLLNSKKPTDQVAIRNLLKTSPGDMSLAQGLTNYEKIVLGFFFVTGDDAESIPKNKRFHGLKLMEKSAISTFIMPEGKTYLDYPQLKVDAIMPNIPFIARKMEHFAFFNNDADPDAIVRSSTLVRFAKDSLMPSLALKMAAKIINREIVIFFDHLGVEDVTLVNPTNDSDIIKIPTDAMGEGRAMINHLGPGSTLPHFSFADAYDNSFTPEQKSALKSMHLLFGPTATGINDQRANPFDDRINGVENHAAFLHNILSKSFMNRPAAVYKTELMFLVILALLLTPFFMFTSAISSGIVAISFIFGVYFFDKYFWFSKGTWIYLGMPVLEIMFMFINTTLYKYLVEEREKRKVKGAFQHYLSPDVMNQVLADPSKLKLGGERKEVTVFFSDVRSFTTISEGLSPEKLCELMNDYLSPMTKVILKSGGVLDKYIGDAIMAFWGAPIECPNHAELGVQSALEMMTVLAQLREDFPKKSFPIIDIGCGLNTGFVSVGNMGSADRFAYTVMGDAVNLSARLESITKEYGVKIILAENTLQKLPVGRFLVRDLDDIIVKGKSSSVKIFELLHPLISPDMKILQDLKYEFERGREFYRSGDFEKARGHFLQCLTLKLDDGPSRLFVERLDHLKNRDSSEEWTGVFKFAHK